MDEKKSIDPDLLRRMMMGEFSPGSFSSAKSTPLSSSTKKNVELDLHFDKLYPHKNHLPASEKLSLQLEALNDFVEMEGQKRLVSALVIVGKGEGVLMKRAQRLLEKKGVTHSIQYNPPYFGNALKLVF